MKARVKTQTQPLIHPKLQLWGFAFERFYVRIRKMQKATGASETVETVAEIRPALTPG
jgi:hypothetical protein